MEIFVLQLNKIKANPNDIEEHIKLLNALSECIDKKYMLSRYNEQTREKDIGYIINNGLLEIVDDYLQPLSCLSYSNEYNSDCDKIKLKVKL